MLNRIFTKQFSRDLKLAVRRGKSLEKFKVAMHRVFFTIVVKVRPLAALSATQMQVQSKTT